MLGNIGVPGALRSITEEEARKINERTRDVNAFSKCLVTAGVVTSAIAGGIYYFGVSDIKPLADEVFKYGGLTTLAGAVLPLLNIQYGIVVSPENEATKPRERKGLLHKVIF